ncbi:hypothetical protein M8C21_016547 [Ambrosia artemisiifolia]|uniref:O-acyltransferase WSD1 C-terminal domain-containing protein n=1 Tax=Ambrosia artemisiifolia TaxID=4212 RepID=A0AAD5G4J1_AMBAR|nr:hypothetical protein M8C21_016547 [Ambrosia artemisiifolia]
MHTINDVLFGIVSYGLSKYLDSRSSKSIREGLRMTGVAMVNLRPQREYQDLEEFVRDPKAGWGNKFGMLVLPTYYHRSGSDPLEYLRRAKAMIDQKKSSLESYFSYKFGYLIMSILGAKAITMHMVSYAGTAYMQILVAKDLVHDPEVLAKCLEDAMLEMKEAALPKIKRK